MLFAGILFLRLLDSGGVGGIREFFGGDGKIP
jgi:hypothetical protein